MSIAHVAACDDLLEIKVSDLRAVRWATRGMYAPGSRLSTRLRARRYVASLLVMVLLALGLAPGVRASLPATLVVPSASAHGAARPDLPDLRSIERRLSSQTPQTSSVSAEDACPRFRRDPKCVP